MCGIIGISEAKNERLVESGLATLLHRGPDDKGIVSLGNSTFGHCRLSIIDLSPLGHQPMEVSDRHYKYSISFNGEIYNYKELRDNLIKNGCQFRGGSDTEVIIQGYATEGKSFFGKMRGMWALAIYDSKKNQIILSRDHFGIKPLYYVIQNKKLYFASEVKAIKKIIGSFSPNTDKYYQLYNLGYFLGEDTCYKEVKKVLPGELIVWSLDESCLDRTFLKLERQVKEDSLSLDNIILRVENSILDSVQNHFIADVEVGLLLSGGTDSSLIATISNKIGKKPVCYHISISGSVDTEYARKIASHLNLTFVESELKENNLKKQYDGMYEWLDMPTSDVSVIPTSLVYKSINKGSKVVLSGEGGDELFGGYLRHSALSTLDEINIFPSPLDNLYSSSNLGLLYTNPVLRRIQEKLSHEIINTYLYNAKTIGFPIEEEKMKRKLFDFYSNHPYKKLVPNNLFFDQFSYLPDSLMYKNDITAMHSSIEARVPLVDKEVLKTISGIPDKFKLSPEYSNKKILKMVLKKYLPDELVERPKKGFGFSFEKFGAEFFVEDYKTAAKFHIKNATDFAINHDLRNILSESNAYIICKKFPRFAFSLITNHKVFTAS